jgi:hypothetical protein
VTRAKHVLSESKERKGAKVTDPGLSSRANARDLIKISPCGRNDNAAFIASWRDKFLLNVSKVRI